MRYLKLYLIMTTLIGLPVVAQPTRNFGAGSTSPTSRQEIGIPDTGKYQKRETPESNRSWIQSENNQKNQKSELFLTHQGKNNSDTHIANETSDLNFMRSPQKSPVFKVNTDKTVILPVQGRNGGDFDLSDDTKQTCPIGNNAETPALLNVTNETTHPYPIINSKSIKGRRVSGSSTHLFLNEIDSWEQNYNRMKKELQNKTGISYSIDVSYMGQRGSPNGHITPWQSQYYGTATWDMFQSDTWGSGSLDIAYELVRYWNGTGAELGSNIGVVSGVNDYTQKANYFYQLSYTQQFAGALDWLSVTLGQFPMYNFDGTTYDSNQQITFINEALSQNGSGTYSTSGIGGYITISPNNFWNISAGTQDATNVDGNRISTSHLDDSKYTTFVSGTINPKNKLGQAVLSVLLYHQPSVPAQPGETNGWSLNAQQNIGRKTAVFARINGASKGITGVRQSYVLGGVYNNPFNRNALDQIGLAAAVNKLDKNVNGAGSRSVENVLEGYWAWGVGSFMTITPDIQFYINPGLNTKSNTATVASIRATMMF